MGLILISAAILILFGIVLYLNKLPKVEDTKTEIAPEVLSTFNFFKQKVEALNNSCHALDNLVNEYFVTLTQGGYSELDSIRVNLNLTLETAQKLLAEGKSEDLIALLDFMLYPSTTKEIPGTLEGVVSDNNFLKDWQIKSEELMKKIEDHLNKVSARYKQVGRTKKRERVATDTVLGEVRKAMLAVAKKSPS